MKKNYLFPIMLIVVMAALILSIPAFADKYTDTMDVFKKSEVVQPFFKNAYGYAVFPTIGKGGIGTGEVSMIKGSIGFQLGGQAFSQMIFFEDKRAYDEFTSGEFEFDATASAVAITAGVQAKAGTEGASAGASAGPATGKQAKTSYYKGMVVFTHAKGGMMYEASIGGQKFTFKPKK